MTSRRQLPPAILALHDAAVAAGRRTYRDPATGAEVFTAASLRAQGACCDSGCRHCPYDADAPAGDRAPNPERR